MARVVAMDFSATNINDKMLLRLCDMIVSIANHLRFLDQKDAGNLDYKLDSFSSVYSQLTGKTGMPFLKAVRMSLTNSRVRVPCRSAAGVEHLSFIHTTNAFDHFCHRFQSSLFLAHSFARHFCNLLLATRNLGSNAIRRTSQLIQRRILLIQLPSNNLS